MARAQALRFRCQVWLAAGFGANFLKCSHLPAPNWRLGGTGVELGACLSASAAAVAFIKPLLPHNFI